jgi:hypothetical protein
MNTISKNKKEIKMIKMLSGKNKGSLSQFLMAVTVIFMSICLPASAYSKPVDCPVFESDQIDVMQKSYALGLEHNLGFTLAAIALKESSAGKYRINALSGDFGVYQGNVETICKQAGIFHKPFQCNMEIQQVVDNIEKAAQHAIETLQYWQNYHKKRTENYLVYQKMIRAYNAGFSFNSGDAETYWTDFRKDFYTVKNCVDFSASHT